MTILPILKRELVAAARKAQLHAGRSVFAGMMLIVLLGFFGSWFYWNRGSVSPQSIGRVARQFFLVGLSTGSSGKNYLYRIANL